MLTLIEKVFGPKENSSVKPREAGVGKSHKHQLFSFLSVWSFIKPALFAWAVVGAIVVLVKLYA